MDAKTLILEKALDLFANRGFGSVGIQEIVDASGITKPTLYHHYGSKQGLLVSILDQKSRPLIVALEEAAGYHHDLTKNLTDLTGVFLNFAVNNSQFYRFFLSLNFLPPESEIAPDVQNFFKRINDPIKTLFLAAEADHGNMRGRSQTYALTYVGMIHTYVNMAIISGSGKVPPDLIYKAVHQYMHGIFS